MPDACSSRRTHGSARRHVASLSTAFAAATLAAPMLGLAGCGGAQSALNPAGRAAHSIAELFWWMAGGALVIWALMVALAIYAIGAKREVHTERRAKLLIVVGGVAFPTVTLTGLLTYGLAMLPELVAPPPAGSLRIAVEGNQWWWRVRYETVLARVEEAASGPVGLAREPAELARDRGDAARDGDDVARAWLDLERNRGDLARDAVELANEIRLPVGEPVEFRLTSADVIHSFWIPSLGGKVDMLPGRETRLVLHPTRTGAFTGVCAEYCGSAHARMAFDVIVVEPHEFEQWLARQREPALDLDDESAVNGRGADGKRASAPGGRRAEGEVGLDAHERESIDAQERESIDAREPSDRESEVASAADIQLVARGRDLFVANGCGACHAVRGTSSDGAIGPDLTHVGSRVSFGARTLRNESGSALRWLTHTAVLKPGVLMPAFDMLPPEDLRALAAYVESLR